MKLLLINSVCGHGSTGRICTDIAKEYESKGWDVKIAYGRDDNVPEEFRKYAIRIGTKADIYAHVLVTRLFDAHGFGSKRATRKFLKWAETWKPDMLWLHNLHGYYINIEELFNWIKAHPEMEIKWTLHDCWAFTGHCSHFTAVRCNRWRETCYDCPNKKQYPASKWLDASGDNYERKRQLFTNVSNFTIISPSKWLAGLVGQSFLKNYPVEVQYNTVDRSIFKPTPSDFRDCYGLQDKIIVLGVASQWTEQKGLNDFMLLAKMLDDHYAVVLVGLTQKELKKLKRSAQDRSRLDNNRKAIVITLPRIYNKKELAAIYTAADYYVNPSREESFGLTTVEATLCGTRVIVYRGTATEEVADLYGGMIVNPEIDEVYKMIVNE